MTQHQESFCLGFSFGIMAALMFICVGAAIVMVYGNKNNKL